MRHDRSSGTCQTSNKGGSVFAVVTERKFLVKNTATVRAGRILILGFEV